MHSGTDNLRSGTDNLRSGLGNTLSDLSKLVNFVESCKDPDVVFSLPDITNAQALQIIKGISPHKAAGIDKISARFLRIAPPILAPSIACAQGLSTCRFPQESFLLFGKLLM